MSSSSSSSSLDPVEHPAVRACVRGALAALWSGVAIVLLAPPGAAATTIAIPTAATWGVILAALMRRARPDGLERAMRVALQGGSLWLLLVVVIPALSSWPLPSSLALRLGVAPDLLETRLAGDGAPLRLPAACFVSVGLFVVAIAMRDLLRGGGTADPFDPPLRRCTTGLYARFAHPMQAGQFAIAVGAALWHGTVGALCGAVGVGVVLVGPVRMWERAQQDDRGDLRAVTPTAASRERHLEAGAPVGPGGAARL